MPNVITLVRVSTDAQDVKRQYTDAAKLQKRYNLNSVETVTIHGVSGTETLSDEQVIGVLERLKEIGVDGAQMSAIDRLFRPAKRFGDMSILDKFSDAGKVLWTNREGFVDPGTPEGKAICWDAAAKASGEWHELRRRSIGGSEELLEEGFPDCSCVPMGYKYIPKHATENARKILLDDRESTVPGISHVDVIRLMFKWRREGLNRYGIAARLNGMGIRGAGRRRKAGTPGGDTPGSLWTRESVLQILRNPTYKGEYHRRGRVFSVPAIVDPALFDEVQRMNTELASKWNGRPTGNYLLRGFVFCGRCGYSYRGYSNWGIKGYSYQCGNISRQPPKKHLCTAGIVARERLEDIAFGAIWETLKNPATLYAAATAAVEQRIGDKGAKAAMKRIAALETRIANTVELRQSNLIPMAKARADISEAQLEISKLERETSTASGALSLPPQKQAEALMREITSGPEPATYENRRPILERLTDLRMTYNARRLEITGSVPIPAAVENRNKRQATKYAFTGFIPFKIKVEVKAA